MRFLSFSSLLFLLSISGFSAGVLLAPDVQNAIYSSNGKLSTTLTIGEATYSNPETGLVQKVVGYNGQIGGPTLYAKPGDYVEITLINDLPAEPCNTFVPEMFNAYHAVDITNIHFHGLHIPPTANPSHLEVRPGESHTFSFQIPEGHNGGTNWYHPHFPGSTSLQAGGGGVGLLVVEDLEGDLPEDMLNLPDLNLRVQFLNMTYLQYDYATGTSGSYVELCRQYCLPAENRHLCTEHFFENGPTEGAYNTTIAPDGLEYETTLVNGYERPTIDLVADQWYRARLLYVPTRFRTLEPTFPTDGCEAHLLAKDGNYMLEVPRIGVSAGFMTSGNRADFLVRCSKLGKHEFRSASIARNSDNWIASQKRNSLDRVLAYFNVVEDKSSLEGMEYANPSNMPVVKPARPCMSADMRATTPDETHILQMSGLLPNGGDIADVLPIERPPCCSETSYYDVNGIGVLSIDHRGEEGAPGREFDFVWQSGSVVEIDYYFPQIHPLHYHINPFQLIELPPLGSYEGYFEVGDFHDVLHTTITDYYGKAKLRMSVGGPVGEILGHCHIYRHSDRGMAYLGHIVGEEGIYSSKLDGSCYVGLENRGFKYVDECFSCEGNDPCNPLAVPGKYYYSHCKKKRRYIQCSDQGQCFDMKCPAKTFWDDAALTCVRMDVV
mmetsp:Transcript_17481/g.24108  ORF Transcript_17481/g.24108 Transcript_17481/m.24108 type:complete len:664 (-) Transcript_17481:245-2236(-)|eukprot:CAMPEP_0185723680 /NCGR_PEP_ID=MMETSP1171-20130828/438_1 /TAXON_ID=374046 /ORGANISM="Helicotheca tamensis, Strain CCMP826" /LENGTH=663 /DNA_ID=CAMNT_0028391419 /DNA_START=57 /DNA_END=2048 /DNA_ORIENTATION=+